MTRLFFILATLSIIESNTYSQSYYKNLVNFLGINNTGAQSLIEGKCNELIQSLPDKYQDSFKVYSAYLYCHSETMEAGIEEYWNNLIASASDSSKYNLLFLAFRSMNSNKIRYRVNLMLPDSNIFYCLDEDSPFIRDNLSEKYSIQANLELNNNNIGINNFMLVESSVINDLIFFIENLKVCCDPGSRSPQLCSTCVFSPDEFSNKLQDYGLIYWNVDKILDTIYESPEESSTGILVINNGDTINIDTVINNMHLDIDTNYPNESFEVFKFNFYDNCSNLTQIRNNFVNSSASIAMMIGYLENTLWIEYISNDLETLTNLSHSSDTCYFFNDTLFYSHKNFCNSGERPRGIFKNFSGYLFDYEFTFSNPIITPRTLTSQYIKDGDFVPYLNTNEPKINRAMLMESDLIFAQIASPVSNSGELQQNNAFTTEPTRFPINFWPLIKYSNGQDAPFDYWAKDFYLDRENYLFVTDDGEYVVGHNLYNMGNFLWGATTRILGVPRPFAKVGAHLFAIFDYGGLDSPDDIYCIELGRTYAKKRKWDKIYGGKNNIYRN